MLPDTINGCLMVSPGQMRHSTLQTLNIYILLQHSRAPRRPRQPRVEGRRRRRKKTARLSLYKHHVMKYKWIYGPCRDDGISRQNIPYRLSRLYEDDILIDVTNKHEVFSSGIRAGNWICSRARCKDADGTIPDGVGGGGEKNDLDFEKLRQRCELRNVDWWFRRWMGKLGTVLLQHCHRWLTNCSGGEKW